MISVMVRIPASSDEEGAGLENRFRNRAGLADNQPGFVSQIRQDERGRCRCVQKVSFDHKISDASRLRWAGGIQASQIEFCAAAVNNKTQIKSNHRGVRYPDAHLWIANTEGSARVIEILE